MYNPLDKPVCYISPPEKIKPGNMHSVTARSQHNFRLDGTSTTNPQRADQNEILVDAKRYVFTTADGEPIYGSDGEVRSDYNFEKQVEERLAEFGIKPKSNANVAMEVCAQITKGFDNLPEGFDTEKWKKETKEFLEDKFGKDNIMSMVYHADEESAHIHCIFTPITPDGRLSSRDLYPHKNSCIELSKEYFDHVKQDGLAPAISGRTMPYANPRSQRKARIALEYAGEVEIVPERVLGESTQAYIKRIEENASVFAMQKQAQIADETAKMMLENSRIVHELEKAQEEEEKAKKETERYKEIAKKAKEERDLYAEQITGSGITRSQLKNAAELVSTLNSEHEAETRLLKNTITTLRENNETLASEKAELEKKVDSQEKTLELYSGIMDANGLTPKSLKLLETTKLMMAGLEHGFEGSEEAKKLTVTAVKVGRGLAEKERNIEREEDIE